MTLVIKPHNHTGWRINLYLIIIMFQVYVIGSFWWFVWSSSYWDTDFSQFIELEWNYFPKRKKNNSNLKLLSKKSSLGYWSSFWCCFCRVHLENVFVFSVPCCHLVLGLVLYASKLIFQTCALIQCCKICCAFLAAFLECRWDQLPGSAVYGVQREGRRHCTYFCDLEGEEAKNSVY